MSTVREQAHRAARTPGGTVFELTSAQLGIWNAQRLEPESPYYLVGDVVQISGTEPIDVGLLAEAMVGTVDDAETLRLRFTETPDGPRQVVDDSPVSPPPVVDVSGAADPVAAAEQQVVRERFAAAEACRGMVDRPLYSQMIIRLSDTEVWYTQLGHHLVFDGYSAAMLARRTAARYTALVTGTEPPKCSFSSFAEFVAADQEYLASDRPERDRAYWVDRLTPLPELGESTPRRPARRPTRCPRRRCCPRTRSPHCARSRTRRASRGATPSWPAMPRSCTACSAGPTWCSHCR
ncbi:condensation domain-containing protein [Prauserella oleivorans]